MPKISVLMPVYNASPYLYDSVKSVLSQSYRDLELIVVDDGSNDGSENILDLLRREDSRVILHHQNNHGVIKTRNKLLQLAKGRSDYIAWCDADDLYLPDKLSKQLSLLENNKDIFACGTWYQKFGDSHRKVRKPLSYEFIKAVTNFGTPVGFPTFFQKNNSEYKFNEALISAEDYEYVGQIVKENKVVNIAEVLTMYRVHSKQESTMNKFRQSEQHKYISKQILKENIPIDALSDSQVNWLLDPSTSIRNVDTKEIFELINKSLPIRDIIPLRLIMDYRILAFNKLNAVNLLFYIKRHGLNFLDLKQIFIR